MVLKISIWIQSITYRLVSLPNEEMSFIDFTVQIFEITMQSLIFFMKNARKRLRHKLKRMKNIRLFWSLNLLLMSFSTFLKKYQMYRLDFTTVWKMILREGNKFLNGIPTSLLINYSHTKSRNSNSNNVQKFTRMKCMIYIQNMRISEKMKRILTHISIVKIHRKRQINFWKVWKNSKKSDKTLEKTLTRYSTTLHSLKITLFYIVNSFLTINIR